MCGIAGLWERRGAGADDLRRTAGAMTEALAHRGPDGSGVWCGESGIALGHRRLAILDLTEAGAQPMPSADGRYVVTYNGELYNSPELRGELEARQARFRGTSDTEVLLGAISAWGLEAALQRFAGLFAFALWDRAERRLTLVRDRLGKKPLYWSNRGGLTLFGSELKALMRHPEFDRGIDRSALAAFLRHAYVPSPLCIFTAAEKLPPASLVHIHADGRCERKVWWDLAAIAGAGLASPREVGESEAMAEADTLIRLAVRQRLLSDVPLGALLSGGVDSSLVVALMQAQAARPVKTFSIGFAETAYDEAADAAAVARHLGTDHTELTVTPADALAVVPKLPEMYDEPFADSSQVPTHLVSALARRTVTVALSGDGGDEIAAGYNRHGFIGGLWPHLRRIPAPLRRVTAGAIARIPAGAWDAAAATLPRRRRLRLASDKAKKFAHLLAADSAEAAYRNAVSHWPDPAALLPGVEEPASAAEGAAAALRDVTGRIQYLDMAGYLPDDILCKVDRASMAVALEVRCPLLDHRVVEFFWTLPRPLLAHAGGRKVLLRRLFARYLPRELFERPKMGFGVPIEHWLRGPLRAWAEELLDEARLSREGVFAPAQVRQAWMEHLTGRADHQYRLWCILMFQAWQARWLQG